MRCWVKIEAHSSCVDLRVLSHLFLGLMGFGTMSGCPSATFLTPVELLPIDVLDLVLSVLGRSPVSWIAFLLFTTSRIVSGRLIPGVELLVSIQLWTFPAPVSFLATVVTKSLLIVSTRREM